MPVFPPADAYRVLGVDATASDDDLRRAYRRLLRSTHPDLGGDVARFHAVQVAWSHICEPIARAQYDARRSWPSTPGRAPRAAGTPRHAAPPPAAGARTYGTPGGSSRERYLAGLRAWLGLPTLPPNPFAPELLSRVPARLSDLHLAARAEERTAVVLSALDLRHSVWNDVAVTGSPSTISHVILAPTGLFAAFTTTWPSPLLVHRGDVVVDGMPRNARPVREMLRLTRTFESSLSVRVTGVIVIAADDPAVAQDVEEIRSRPLPTLLAPRSRLGGVIRDGVPGPGRGDGDDLATTTERLRRGILFA